MPRPYKHPSKTLLALAATALVGSTAACGARHDLSTARQAATLCSGLAVAASSAGTLFTLSASGACGGPTEYRFLVRPPGLVSYQEVRAFGAGTTASWETAGLARGRYDLLIQARPAGSTAAAEQAWGSALVGAVCRSLVSSAIAATGGRFDLTASAVCDAGASPEYRFLARAPGAATYQDLRTWGAAATHAWSTAGLPTGRWDLLVQARAAGSASAYEAQAWLSATVGGACPGVTLAATPAGAGQVGLAAAATCSAGASAEYRFLVRPPGATGETELRPWGGATFTLATAGLAPGWYDLLVEARAVGSASARDSSAWSSTTVGAVCRSATISAAAGAGALVGLAAAASCDAGTVPEFRFLSRAAGGVAYREVRGWGGPSHAWSVAGLPAGRYDVLVQARAAGNSSTSEAQGWTSASVSGLEPAAVVKVAGDGQIAAPGAAVAAAPQVLVTNGAGLPAAGVPVAFAPAGNGAVAAAVVVTGADGKASCGAWTLGPASGPQSLTATVPGVAAVTFTATAVRGSAPVVRLVAPATGTLLGASILVVATVDASAPIVSVTADAGAGPLPLAAGTYQQVTGWGGTFSAAGLPSGPRPILVTATDTNGHVGTALAVPVLALQAAAAPPVGARLAAAAPATLAAELRFATPGCYASTDPMGGAVPVAFARFGAAEDWVAGVPTSCPTGTARVSDDGLVAEGTRVNFVRQPDRPATETRSYAAGVYTTWVEGAGSLTVSAAGAVTTGLPCTATEGQACLWGVAGAGSVTVSASGSLRFAQTELGSYPTSRIHAAARMADAASIPNPLPPGDFCVAATVKPTGGRRWATASGQQGVLSAGTFGTANAWALYINGGIVRWDVFDGAAALRSVAVRLVPGAAADGSTHRLLACAGAAGTSLRVDGSPFGADRATGTGTGLVAAQPPTVLLGSRGAGNEASASLSDVRLYQAGFVPEVQASEGATVNLSVACVGDSITRGIGLATPYPDALSGLLGLPYYVSNQGVSGNRVADIAARWGAGVRDGGFAVAVFEGGINDVMQLPGACSPQPGCIAQGLMNLYSDALMAGTRVVATTLLPFRGSAAWTAQREAVRQQVNAWLLATCAGAPGVIDCVDAAADFDDGTGAMKAAYDSGDHLHPGQAGATRLAELVRAALP